MTDNEALVAEYIQALKASEQFGPQVVAHRTLPATRGSFRPYKKTLHPDLASLLHRQGLTGLYSHQEQAIARIREQQHVLVATPTASGKSLIYNLPVFEEIIRNPKARALYLFPLKALAQDQLGTINQWTGKLPEHFAGRGLPPATVYDGDTSGYQRKKIREHVPPFVLTNPDMLHLSMLPYHHLWGALFSNLTHVVLDEVHTYRGVFGSHMAWVIRRLRRICALYGSDPVFILSSATIGNPLELAENLLGEEICLIAESGAPQAARNIILYNPLDSAPAAATALLAAALHRGLRTIVYTQSRKLTELITLWCQKRRPQDSDKIASYRAGFLPEDRRAIEKKLVSGELLGVISTSALELGIDIGGLDICLLVGFPGSMMATWQRAGRVGRSGRESLVVLIAQEDALDQNFMRHPEAFFDRPVEPVTLDPANPQIGKAHLCCAAAESPLSLGEAILSRDSLSLVHQLTTGGALLQSADGKTWFSKRKYPQRHVNLRGTGNAFLVFDTTDGGRKLLGELDGHRACKECHEGAVYLHMARTWLVERLDLDERIVLVHAARPPYYTRTTTDKDTEILATLAEGRCGAVRVWYGRLRITEHILSYSKILIGKGKVIEQIPLNLPPQILETTGMWLEIPQQLKNSLEQEQYHFMGAIHALEHAMIGIMPLMVLCDRNDIGGISHPFHDQVGQSAIFLYDGYEGGIGLCKKGFSGIDQLLIETEKIVRECDCELGCPSCVHSPKCGSGNRPIDKAGCLQLLQGLLRRITDQQQVMAREQQAAVMPAAQKTVPVSEAIQLPERWGVFDLETQRSAAEVGGWHRADKMGISMGVVYDSAADRFVSYDEHHIPELVEHLFSLDLVVGFNNKRFDNQVLQPYTDKKLSTLPSFDILEQIYLQLGYRLSLDRLAEHTLGSKKSANGLQALQWYQEGELEKIREYCEMDVRITRDLFLHGLEKGYLLFSNKAGKVVRLQVDFAREINRILELTKKKGP